MFLRYWRALLGGRFKLWQLIALGLLWIGAGGAMILTLGSTGDGLGSILILSGVGHFVVAAIGVKMHEQLDEKLDQLDERNELAMRSREEHENPVIPSAPKAPQPVARVMPVPPRIGNDPFRDPPAARPLAIVHTATPPKAVAVARADSQSGAENAEAKPKFLV